MTNSLLTLIYGEIFSHILGSRSSYMTLQLLHSEFPNIWGKVYFLFYQCTSPEVSGSLWWQRSRVSTNAVSLTSPFVHQIPQLTLLHIQVDLPYFHLYTPPPPRPLSNCQTQLEKWLSDIRMGWKVHCCTSLGPRRRYFGCPVFLHNPLTLW